MLFSQRFSDGDGGGVPVVPSHVHHRDARVVTYRLHRGQGSSVPRHGYRAEDRRGFILHRSANGGEEIDAVELHLSNLVHDGDVGPLTSRAIGVSSEDVQRDALKVGDVDDVVTHRGDALAGPGPRGSLGGEGAGGRRVDPHGDDVEAAPLAASVASFGGDEAADRPRRRLQRVDGLEDQRGLAHAGLTGEEHVPHRARRHQI